MNVFTAPQRKALESAAKTGNAWNAWGNVYRTSTNRMMQALCARGLLTHDGRPTDKTANALGVPVARGTMSVGDAVVSSALGGSTVDRSSYTQDTQVVGRVMRTYQAEAVEDARREHESGESFLANSARQLGIDPGAPGGEFSSKIMYLGRDVKIEFAHGPADADPRTLTWSPVREISVIYFPMRKGIKRIVVRRKAK